jgi:hypothetical protein
MRLICVVWQAQAKTIHQDTRAHREQCGSDKTNWLLKKTHFTGSILMLQNWPEASRKLSNLALFNK